ncbi:Hypothetical_protein [Hexamita inflata]|uniref:Hypothetical_protein n=1 Tax=Hexamita inflata TaxID=28002 RepID=A0AA86QND6_9EUKA|nr:Hypothetical protein HINF_LOCUS47487 [Hexamita inflata]
MNQTQQTEAMCTEVFKQILSIIFKINMNNKSNKELCQIIDNLQYKNQFWQLVQHKFQYYQYSTYQTVLHTEFYYNVYYRQALFSERLNEADCQYLEQYFEQNDYVVSELVLQLMEGYFKNRSIFPYEVSRQLHKIENQQQRKIQEEKKNEIKNKIEQQQRQDKLCKPQKETYMNINEIKISENFGEQYNKQGLSDLQTSKQPIIANEILGMPLGVQDKANIYNYMQQHIYNKRNIRTAQITEELVNAFFKEANIFTSVIEEYVDQLLKEHKSQLKSDNPQNSGIFGMFDASSQLNIKLKSNYEDVKDQHFQKDNVY